MKFTAPVVAKIKEMVSLQDAISGLKAKLQELYQNDEKLRKEALEKANADPCYQAIVKLYDDLKANRKAIEELYIHWFLNRDENWDFSYYNAEREKELSPLVKEIESLEAVILAKRESLFKKYYNTQELDDCKHAHREKCSELRYNFEQQWVNILGYQDLVKELEATSQNGSQTYVSFTPHLLTEDSGTVDIELSVFIENTIDVDEEEFKTEEDLKSDFEQNATISDEQYDQILEILEKHHLKIVKESVSEVNVADINGSTFHHKGYYERDTGYGEPAGEFYYGKVTCSGDVYYVLTVE